MKPVNRTNLLALALGILTTLAAYYFVAENTFEQIPHIEDEMAFVWQARVFSESQITIPSPPQARSFFIPFVIDYNGQRFSKYPPGWPMMLSLGIRLGFRSWVNPILAGLVAWLTYRLGWKLFSGKVGLLAALLTATSPFFLVNAGSLLSHTWSLFLTLAFFSAWIDTFELAPKDDALKQAPKWMTTSVAGLTLGLLAITRPVTALGVATPFTLHALHLLVKGSHQNRKHVLAIGILAALVSSFLLIWQYDATGNPLLNPYTLYWPYDKIGFGEGIGRQQGGHSLYWAQRNIKITLKSVERDLFGWGMISWVFLPFGFWASRRKLSIWLALGIPFGLAGFYATYWVTSTITGPRYYFEGILTASLLSAAGIVWLAGAWEKTKKLRFVLTGALIAFLLGYNQLYYLPNRLESFNNLYGIQRADIELFLTPEAEALAPALVFVHVQETWTDYGALLDLQDPWLTSPFIFTRSRSRVEDEGLMEKFPQRRIIHYYPDDPSVFYQNPR